MRMLATLVEARRSLVNDKTRITNRLTVVLKQYFPQALNWFEHRDTIVFCDFLRRWPTLKHVKRARSSTLQAFFREHNVRFSNLVEERIQAIRAAIALTDDRAVIEPCELTVQPLVEQLSVTLAPRLLVAFGEQRERYASAAELQQYSGIAPVIERSGSKCWTHWRHVLSCLLPFQRQPGERA